MDRTRPSLRRGVRPCLALAFALSLPLALAGCGQAGDAARGAASGAASSAASSASSAASSAAGGLKSAASDQLLKELCKQTTGSGALADVKLTDKERAAAGRLADAASAAGVANKYVTPLRQIADSRGQQGVADAVTALRDACASR